MYPFVRLGFALLALAAPLPANAAGSTPVGQWEVTTGESRYRISFCEGGDKLCAKLTWLRDDARTAKNLALLGNYVVRGAAPAEANIWTGTVTYDGETYEGKVTLVDTDTMRLQSCSGVFCRTFELHRL